MVARERFVKKIHAFEQLQVINDEKDEHAQQDLLVQYGAVAPLNFILSLNFNHAVKLDLPEGMPPLDLKDMDALTHPDLMGLLSANIGRLRHCTVQSDLKKIKKEQIFYEVLSNCPLKDAEIVCSAKDRALEELFPAITADVVAKAFPSYVRSA